MATVNVVRFKPELCKGCLECEKACSNIHFKTDAGGERSAIRIFEKEEGGYEMLVCSQCGLCLDMCPVGALKRGPKGQVLLNRNKCIGCQACVGFCPIDAMMTCGDRIEPFKCISCGACIKACPEGALYFEETAVEDIREVVYQKQGA